MTHVVPIPYTAEEPIPLMRELPPGAAYPFEALGPMRAAAEAVHDITQAPMALCAQSALGVASLAAQGLTNVETLAGPAPVSLFLLSVAESGSRKSTADRKLMAPVFEHQRALSDAAREEDAIYQNRRDVWEGRRKEIMKGVKKDPDGARADLDALGPAPEPPLSSQIVSTEPTVEGIIRGLSGSRPSLGIFSDEGGMFLGGSGMSEDNRQKTISSLSSFWDGAAINRTRAGDGAVTHYGKRLAMHLMVQPVVADSLLGDRLANGQGFLARFLMAAPSGNFGSRLHRDPLPGSAAAIERFSARIGEMLRADLPLRDGTRNEIDPPLLALDRDARALLKAFSDEVERAQITGGDLEAVRPFASKSAEHAARIAGVMACFAGARSVSVETMADAIMLATFHLGETKRLFDAATISRETADAQRLLDWLRTSWPEPVVSPTDATQNGPFRETTRVRSLFKVLVEFRWLTPIDGGAEIRGKRRREACRINRGET